MYVLMTYINELFLKKNSRKIKKVTNFFNSFLNDKI